MRIALDAADYWKLRALIRDVDAAEHDLLSAEVRLRAAVALATKKRAAFYEEMATKYGFDANADYGWDDASLQLRRSA
jgi:hypothetical protein